jgi:hypothetical protein
MTVVQASKEDCVFGVGATVVGSGRVGLGWNCPITRESCDLPGARGPYFDQYVLTPLDATIPLEVVEREGQGGTMRTEGTLGVLANDVCIE